MKNYKVGAYFGLISCLLLYFTLVKAGVLSNGAPIAHTNAPGETNCTQSGCHNDHLLNSGTGSISLTSDSGLTKYEAGKTYTFHVRVSQKDLIRFGFQLVVLNDLDSSNAGSILVSDYKRTQLMSEESTFKGRNYLTYTFDGSSAVSGGSNVWDFNWTAPNSTNAGNVSLYLAGVAANNDQTDKGDYTYTTSMHLLSSNRTGIEAAPYALNNFSVSPNPIRDYFTISINNLNADYKIDIMSLQGKLLQHFEENNNSNTFKVNDNLSDGIYLLVLYNNGHRLTKKIFINKQ
jgi:hypothetical protein